MLQNAGDDLEMLQAPQQVHDRALVEVQGVKPMKKIWPLRIWRTNK